MSSPLSDQKFGLSVALVTPFDAHHKIDTTLMVAHAQNCLEKGVGSITLFGTTGEGASIAVGERAAVIDAFIAGGIPASRLVIAVMESAVAAAVAQIEDARQRGCKAILLGAPFYYKGISDEALFSWISAVFAQVTTKRQDIILYNIPQVTGVAFSVGLISRLRDAFGAHILGIKDSSGDWNYTQKLLAEHHDCAILIGDERHLAAGIRLGGQGAISGMANLCPQRMLKGVIEGKEDADLCHVVDQLCVYSVTSAIKSMLAHLKADETWARMRPPLDRLDKATFSAVADLSKILDKTLD